MVMVQKISQKDWDYTLYRYDGGYVLSVLCGTVGMYELNVPLDKDEEGSLGVEGGVEQLANKIRTTPSEFSGRSIEISEA